MCVMVDLTAPTALMNFAMTRVFQGSSEELSPSR